MATFTSFVATTTVPAPMATASSNPTNLPQNGIRGGYPGDNKAIMRAMTAFAAISWYNAAELIILIFIRFKRKIGLYFWSMFITSCAIIIYQVGAWGKMLEITRHSLVTVIFLNVGWIIMIVGQSIVLYSRLHLITQSRKTLNAVLWMIIINSTLMYIPTATLTFGANVANPPQLDSFTKGYEKMERIQMTLFTVQELIISGVYLYEVGRYLKMIMENNIRKLMWELFIVNVALVVLDVVLLVVEYKNYYEIEVTLKGMVYSIKLKLELGVLSKLVKIVTARNDSHMMTGPDQQQLDLSRFASAKCANEYLRESNESPSDSDDSHSRTNLTAQNAHGFPQQAPPHGYVPQSAPGFPQQGPPQGYSPQNAHGFPQQSPPPHGHVEQNAQSYAEQQNSHGYVSRRSVPLTGPNESIPAGTHLPALPLPAASRRSSVGEMYPGKL